MRILTEDGALNPRIEEDPRVTESQGSSMLKAARADEFAEVVGMDAKLRPIVRARLGGAKTRSDFALFRGGAPAPITEPVTEEWEVEGPPDGS